jgi:electron transfer flavoprotein alpha subunit
MEKILLFAEDGSQLSELFSFAESVGADSVDYMILNEAEIADKKKDESNQSNRSIFYEPENLAKDLFVATKDDQYEIVVLPATKLGREIAPRLAVLLHAGYVEGVVNFDRVGPGILFRRLTLGGTCLETIDVKTQTKIITLKMGRDSNLPSTQIKKNEIRIFDKSRKHSKELVEKRTLQAVENIQSTDRIVAIGRGIKKKEDISMVEEFARALGAKIGVTRPLVEDLNWYPKENQIGLSGNSVRPRLYIGLGISGQIQHIVGMRESKVVVAINKDKSAPIFAFADYCVIGDLYGIVPEMMKLLKVEN